MSDKLSISMLLLKVDFLIKNKRKLDHDLAKLRGLW